jgi:hypothetical protein
MKQLFLYDLKASFYTNRWKYVGSILLFLLIFLLVWLESKGTSSSDLFYDEFRGSVYEKKDTKIPYFFLAVQFYFIFLIGDFVYSDYTNLGTYILSRSKRKIAWIVSKVINLCLWTVLFYTTFFFVLSLCTGFTYEWNGMSEVVTGERVSPSELDAMQTTWTILFLMTTTSLAMGMLHLTLSFVVKPIYSFMLMIGLYAFPVFSPIEYIPGNYSMLVRHAPFTDFTIGQSTMYNALIFIVSFVVLIFIVNRKDIIENRW